MHSLFHVRRETQVTSSGLECKSSSPSYYIDSCSVVPNSTLSRFVNSTKFSVLTLNITSILLVDYFDFMRLIRRSGLNLSPFRTFKLPSKFAGSLQFNPRRKKSPQIFFQNFEKLFFFTLAEISNTFTSFDFTIVTASQTLPFLIALGLHLTRFLTNRK